jgi:D-sedoheptulose 7-phosphate isomerase
MSISVWFAGLHAAAVTYSDVSQFDDVVVLLKDVRSNGQLHFIGNGGSAAIASHMAVDFFNKGKFAARSFNDSAALTCIANDYGYKSVFDMQVARVVKRGDVLVAISSSGESDNIIRAAKTAKMVTDVVTLTGFGEKNRLRALGTYNFYVPSKNYGWVETAHLGLLHAILEAVSI